LSRRGARHVVGIRRPARPHDEHDPDDGRFGPDSAARHTRRQGTHTIGTDRKLGMTFAFQPAELGLHLVGIPLRDNVPGSL